MGILEHLLCQAAEGPGLTEVIVIMPLFSENPEKIDIAKKYCQLKQIPGWELGNCSIRARVYYNIRQLLN